MPKYLWTWHGRHFGYRDGNDLWTPDGRHVGQFFGDEVYDAGGHYLGEIMSGNRLVTNQGKKHYNKTGHVQKKAQRGFMGSRGDNGPIEMPGGHEEFPEL